MPRYFLHLKEGSDLLHDPEGQEFGDLDAARLEAVEAAREVMADDLRSGRPLGLHRVIVIAGENGDTLSEIVFKAALPGEDPES